MKIFERKEGVRVVELSRIIKKVGKNVFNLNRISEVISPDIETHYAYHISSPLWKKSRHG